MPSIHIIYASTSGHTEFVVGLVQDILKEKGMTVVLKKAEQTKPEDLQKGDVLLLASGTWNTGGIEGQLNPHMQKLVQSVSAKVDFDHMPVAIIGLGDERYHYTCRAADHLETFVNEHGGKQAGETLRIINEPYAQQEKIEKWALELQKQLS